MDEAKKQSNDMIVRAQQTIKDAGITDAQLKQAAKELGIPLSEETPKNKISIKIFKIKSCRQNDKKIEFIFHFMFIVNFH
jgi:hypothetical protein